MEKEKARHIRLIQEKGRFHIDCNTIFFSTEELKLLEKYGHWFKALADGLLYPITEKQRLFVEMTKGNRDPFSIEEKAWFKYFKRKELEYRKGDKFYNTPRLNQDPFHSTEGFKSLKKSMFSSITESGET